MFFRILRKLLGWGLSRVQVPENLPLRVALPKYLLLEFHNLPNGNYSHAITDAYVRGFDRAMLGAMKVGRAALAKQFAGCGRVLDVGCGGGDLSAAIHRMGVSEVVGLDASPYMLKHAIQRHPQIRFLQGLAEDSQLESQSFDGIGACFLFHELPPKAADAALIEFHRLLKPKGRFVMLEPGPEQFYEPSWKLLRFGWKGPYYRWLAHLVNEPYVELWHQRDVKSWLANHGFRIVREERLYPSHLLVAERA
jgi:ubiquinone/menaquinone biosynthesis C-methylase UbiE